jgi:3',5'-cyclic AMP phosphodiesterase CpdA
MFTLAHISDPHLGPLPPVRWRELASKRAFGYVNWRGRRAATHGPGSLSPLVDDLKAQAPDHIAVTGDLINIGLPAEIDAARGWLDRLGAETDVSLVPGNHDAYLPGAMRHYRRSWGPFMQGDEAGVDFPFVRRRGPVALVGVSSAVATAPLMATGRVGDEQAEALGDILDALGREDVFRVVLIHHPPVARSTPWHRRLVGAARFRRVVRSAGAELILHGHNHVTSVASLPGPRSAVPVVGAAAASLQPRDGMPRGSYILYRIARSKGAFVCDMAERGARSPGGPVETIAERRLI